MKEVSKTVTTYVAEDGKEFLLKTDCEKHEQTEKDTTYWYVIHSPDLTDGRGYYGVMHVRVTSQSYLAEELVEDWCFRTFGRKVQFAQGVVEMRGWAVHKSTAQKYREKSGGSVGDTRTEGKQVTLIRGPQETGLTEAP